MRQAGDVLFNTTDGLTGTGRGRQHNNTDGPNATEGANGVRNERSS